MVADHTRDPCPIVILNDFGGAFSMGVIGGTIWHGLKGFRNSPIVSSSFSSVYLDFQIHKLLIFIFL